MTAFIAEHREVYGVEPICKFREPAMKHARSSRRHLGLSAVQGRVRHVGRAGLSMALLISAVTTWAACPETPAEFRRAIKGADPVVRREVSTCFVQTSVQFSWAELEAAVAAMLEDRDATVRGGGLSLIQAALWAGTATNEDIQHRFIPALRKILNSNQEARNRMAAGALLAHLGAAPDTQLRGALLRLLRVEDPAIAAQALDALEELGYGVSPEVADILVASARSSAAGVRRVAYRGLGRVLAHGDDLPPGVLQGLQAGLRDAPLENRIEAAQSLALLHRFAGPAESDLQDIVWNPKEPPELRKVAQAAVEQITGKPIQAPWLSRSADLPASQAGEAGSPTSDEPSR